MRTEDLLERCLQALSAGQELPPDVMRYLARHPDQRAQVEDLLFVAQRASQLPTSELRPQARIRMEERLASRLGFDSSVLRTPSEDETLPEQAMAGRTKPRLLIGKLSLARLRYSPPPPPRNPVYEARIREVFRDLTPEEIRRYIGVRGVDYLHYRLDFPYWRPIFIMLAALLRGFKRIEKFVAVRYD